MPTKSEERLLDEHYLSLIAQGNHDAFNRFAKRYRKHSHHLVKELLIKYPDTGVTKKELILVCDHHFRFVVAKYNPLIGASFLTFWKESTKNVVMDYLYDNSYQGGAFSFRGVISFDEENDLSMSYSELLAEKDDAKRNKKRIFEVKTVLYKYKNLFDKREFILLNLALNGFTYVDFEKSEVMSRTTIHLTFKNAVKKLNKLLKKDEKK